MTFIEWWFATHWIWATVLTPGMSFLYALFTEQTGWAWVCALWWLVIAAAKRKDES